MQRVPLSLTVCTHVEYVPAQLQRQSSAATAAAGNLKPVLYLKMVVLVEEEEKEEVVEGERKSGSP